MTAPVTWSFTTARSRRLPVQLWSTDTLPAVTAATDTKEIELGVRFTADIDGWITGVRFYKGAGNTGIHTGSLWTAGGTLLATATFTGESATGWQQVTFPAPIHDHRRHDLRRLLPRAGRALRGDRPYFTTPRDNSPLHAPATAVGPQRRATSTAHGFPTSTFNATNYWVDVSFTTTAPPDTVRRRSPPSTRCRARPAWPPPPRSRPRSPRLSTPRSVVFTLRDPRGRRRHHELRLRGQPRHVHPVGAAGRPHQLHRVGDAANDLAGNPLAAPSSWTFSRPRSPPQPSAPARA